MKVKLSPTGEKWKCGEDDITRHSLIYELIELTRTLVAFRLEDEAITERLAAARVAAPQRDLSDIDAWVDTIDEDDHSATVIMGTWEFDPEGEPEGAPPARVILGAFAEIDSFFLILSVGIFEASVQLMYSRADDEIDFIAGYVPRFRGDPMKALHWLQDYGEGLLDEAAGAESETPERSAAATEM